ncbi:MAG: DNA mismatch repair protein [Cytophagaceae bacterium]|nr:DNA mismatch repair protein [Cytophagaceae bacterium]
MKDIYIEQISKYTKLLQDEKLASTRIGTLRLLAALLTMASVYIHFSYDSFYAILFILLGGIVFFSLIKKHNALKKQILLYKELININENEVKAIQGDLTHFPTGLEYVETEHPYTHDLDIFGRHSLFQHVNRTCTAIGRNKLASLFKTQNQQEILTHQYAIKELSEKIDWRQHFTAKGLLNKDDKNSIDNIRRWVATPSYFQSHTLYKKLGYILPAVLYLFAAAYLITDQDIYYQAVTVLFFINLGLFGFLLKHIKKDYEQLADSSKRLFMYSQLIADIEGENFQSEKLKQYQQKLFLSNTKAHKALEELSRILFRIESMNYGLPAIFSNGLFLYNIHSIYALEEWKQRYASGLEQWLEIISEIDALNSLANFAFNNPAFIYPIPSISDQLIAEEMGHPLIPAAQRVCNSIAFTDQKFVILTGSNMSGKSTFLRTLGLNLILAKMGAPVCASQFIFHPFEVFLSMRINDSLSNNESFFFAELKRLKLLIEQLTANKKTFIMLDEILRGTNSNDKYEGTVGLVKKLIAQRATGIIATHDLSVTQLTNEYPDYLANKCFEVEIRAEDLYFDYKLKPGVCEKMSASFLMKKLDII